MNKKLLNKVMKKLASSNVVISPTVKSSSTSLSMQKKPETEQVQQKLEQYLLSRYHFRFNLLTEQTECCKKVSVSAILSCRPFFILIFLPCIKMNHYGFSRKSIWKNLETFP